MENNIEKALRKLTDLHRLPHTTRIVGGRKYYFARALLAIRGIDCDSNDYIAVCRKLYRMTLLQLGNAIRAEVGLKGGQDEEGYGEGA